MVTFAAAAAAAAESNQGGVATKERTPAPAALRAKGIDDSAPPLTYSGPSEDADGSVEVKRSGGAKPSGNGGGGTRRERREAARQRGRHAKKA